jgi:glycine cleavage system H protein
MIPENLKYTPSHEWVRVEGAEAVFGITDHAQHELGDITYVELPAIGKTVAQFGAFGTVESVKAASEVYAPVAGEVVAVNENLEDAPQLLNESPYEAGWICRVKITDIAGLDALLDAAAYAKVAEED